MYGGSGGAMGHWVLLASSDYIVITGAGKPLHEVIRAMAIPYP